MLDEMATVSAVPSQVARLEAIAESWLGVQLAPLSFIQSVILIIRCSTSWVNNAIHLNSETRQLALGAVR